MNACSRQRRFPRQRPARRHGIGLVELTASLGVMAILLGAMVSTLFIATRALDNGTAPVTALADSSETAERIASDLTLAASFTERTANAATFTVPDRNGDGNMETIRYAWSGVVGAPLTRSYNGGTAKTVASNVAQFKLTYLTRTMGPPAAVDGTEAVLISHDTAAGGTATTATVNNVNWYAQFFLPTLPPNATAWRVTRAKVYLCRGTGTNETLAMEIRTADSSYNPTSTVLASATASATALPTSYGWWECVFNNFPSTDPATGLCLVIRQTTSNGGSAAALRYYTSSSPLVPYSAFWTTTTNAGGSWNTPQNTADMGFSVSGIITTQGP